MGRTEKLGAFLREVSNWSWDEFVTAERDPEYTTNEALIFALVRSCAMEKMDAIRLSLNRLDGKLVTPVKIEYPKIFFLFPNATALTAPPAAARLDAPPPDHEAAPEVLSGDVLPAPVEAASEEEVDLSQLSLRETLAKMSGYSRQLPGVVSQMALETEIWLRGQGEKPRDIPRVKSVVAAHLLIMAQQRDIGALTEVFDQLDGKLVETLRVLGDDIYITNYSQIAPPEATLNKDGVLQLEATMAQNIWAEKLRRDTK